MAGKIVDACAAFIFASEVLINVLLSKWFDIFSIGNFQSILCMCCLQSRIENIDFRRLVWPEQNLKPILLARCKSLQCN
jgi:hypothetical protein